MTANSLLRHGQSSLPRSGSRKAPPRGASRLVVKEPLPARLRRALLRGLRYLSWPLLMAALGVASYQGALRLLPYVNRPIARVGVDGPISDANRQSIQQHLTPFVQTRFFSVDLVAIQHELEALPLVASAHVQRVWPDKLEVALQMEIPIARWGDGALLNNQGNAFSLKDLTPYQQLPQLRGPERDEQKVMEQYHALSQLLRPHGLSIAELDLHERGSWFLTTAANARGPGIELYLGGDQLVEKMQRFLSLYEKTLKGQIANIKSIDLRYANGLAVAWRQPDPTAAPATAADH